MPPLKTVPHFDNEDEEREFWDTADSTEYLDWDKATRPGRCKVSYCRWSDGPWYVYWDVASGPTRDTQVLAIDWSIGIGGGFTYPEVLAAYEAKDLRRLFPQPEVPDEELELLVEPVAAWLGDVAAADEVQLKASYDKLWTRAHV